MERERQRAGVAVLGIYVSDTAYLAKRMPAIGETIGGSGFSIGPGGKGSNQAIAAARAGADTSFITKLGDDAFGEMARKACDDAGVTLCLSDADEVPTGAAFIFVNEENGDNAIIVCPGSGGTLGPDDVLAQADVVARSAVFVTQLEQPVEAALQGLRIAREKSVTTVFNPAPANPFPDELYGLCDYIVPNESEATALVGFPVITEQDARRAAEVLVSRGARNALITLGERGVYVHTSDSRELVPAVCTGTVLDTSGAGDAFVGGFSAALAAGENCIDAVRFGCATAGISVTRRGTAPSMPSEDEIRALMSSGHNPARGGH